MGAIINISSLSPSVLARQALVKSESVDLRSSPLPADRVEISDQARALALAAQASSDRLAKTRAIRAAIQNGTFETPERIRGTVERLFDALA